MIDWIFDIDSDNDEESAFGWNDTYESDCYNSDADD
jgi:hypothetical protein